MENARQAVLVEVITIGAVVACLALITGFFLYEPMRTPEFWKGDKGWLEVLAPLGAVVAASVAAVLAYHTYRANRRNEVTERFRAGAELLGDDKEAAQAAGIKMLGTTALAAPREYLIASVQTLVAFIASSGKLRRDVIFPKDSQQVFTAASETWPDSSFVTVAAIIAACRLGSQITDEMDTDGVRYKGRLVIEDAIIIDRHLFSTPCRNMHFDHVALQSVQFDGWDFENTIIEGIGRSVVFKDCRLKNAHIRLRNRHGQAGAYSTVSFLGENVIDGARYWGRDLAEYIDEEERFAEEVRQAYTQA
jgi:tellurite resistance protein